MKRRKNVKEIRHQNKQKLIHLRIQKQKFLNKCEKKDTCPYQSTCPECNKRICNSNSRCCKSCVESATCPMKGIK